MFQRTEKLASMPKYEQIPQKSNTHKTEVLYGRTTPSGGALVLNPAQCGLLAQSAWWDNPRLDKMLDYHSVFQEGYTFARSFFSKPSESPLNSPSEVFGSGHSMSEFKEVWMG